MVIAATRPHVAAVEKLLRDADLTVFVSRADDEAQPPWVVIDPSPGVPEAGSLGEVDSDLEMPFMTRCVGLTSDQALWLSDKVSAALNRARPPVTGRSCWPIWRDTAAANVTPDRSTAETYFVATTRWRLRSQPA